MDRTQVAVNRASEMRTTRFRDTMSTSSSERSEVVRPLECGMCERRTGE